MSYTCHWKCNNFLSTCFILLWSKTVLYPSNKQEKDNLTSPPSSPKDCKKWSALPPKHTQPGQTTGEAAKKNAQTEKHLKHHSNNARTLRFSVFFCPHKNRYIGHWPEAEAVEIRLTHVIKNREGGAGGCTGPLWPTTNSSMFKVQILRREREGRLAAGKENRLAADTSL